MAAPQGNEFWKLRSKHGRDKIFTTPELLWEAASEYFTWCQDNPIAAQQNLGTKNINTVNFIRPFTKDGLCLFLDIDDQTFNNYRDGVNNDGDKGFLEVCRKIERVIRSQKFDGAAVGIFNAAIIARDLGLKESTEHSGNLTLTQITGMNVT